MNKLLPSLLLASALSLALTPAVFAKDAHSEFNLKQTLSNTYTAPYMQTNFLESEYISYQGHHEVLTVGFHGKSQYLDHHYAEDDLITVRFAGHSETSRVAIFNNTIYTSSSASPMWVDQGTLSANYLQSQIASQFALFAGARVVARPHGHELFLTLSPAKVSAIVQSALSQVSIPALNTSQFKAVLSHTKGSERIFTELHQGKEYLQSEFAVLKIAMPYTPANSTKSPSVVASVYGHPKSPTKAKLFLTVAIHSSFSYAKAPITKPIV